MRTLSENIKRRLHDHIETNFHAGEHYGSLQRALNVGFPPTSYQGNALVYSSLNADVQGLRHNPNRN